MDSFRRFGISSIFTGKHSIFGLLDTEDEGEMSEIYPATRRHIPEELNLSNTAVRTLNLANNKHIFTSTLHFSVLKILPGMSSVRPGYNVTGCPTAVLPSLRSLSQLCHLSYRSTSSPVTSRYQSISRLITTVLPFVQIWP